MAAAVAKASVQDSTAGRGAIQQQRELLAELLGVGGPGLAGGFGEPRRKGPLVVAGEQASLMARVLDLDGRPDERTQGRVDVEDGEEALAGREVGAVEHLGQDVGIESAQVLGDQFVLAGEVPVERPLGHSRLRGSWSTPVELMPWSGNSCCDALRMRSRAPRPRRRPCGPFSNSAIRRIVTQLVR